MGCAGHAHAAAVNARILLFALALAGCHGSSSSSVDAAASARPKIVRPRVVASSEMPLDLAASKLHLVMLKDRVTPVDATMGFRDGALGKTGARLSVDLDTFDSQIAIRNERVRNIFFETSAIGWESADVTFDLPPDLFARLETEKKLAGVALEGTLRVHGGTSKLSVIVDAGWDGPKIWVKSTGPVSVKVSDLGLVDNLHRLNAICMHDSIDDVVKVDVSLVFTPASQ